MREDGVRVVSATDPRIGWQSCVGAILCLAALAWLAGCGGGAAPTSAPTVAPTAAPTSTATVARTPSVAVIATASRVATVTRTASPGATATRGVVTYPDVVRLAVEALATDLGVPRDQIAVDQVEARDWPDSSLGCPQPGRAYLQVITPGYRVILMAGGKAYEYHTNERAMVVRCSP
jgi:hypothetical protein